MSKPSMERIAVAVVVSGAAALVGHVGLRALGWPWWLAAGLALLLGAAAGWWLARRLPGTLDGLRLRRPGLCVVWALLSALALVQTARVSAFMIDPARRQQSLMPWDDWMTVHSCLTAYTEAARFQGEGKPNIYDPRLYADRSLGGFHVDLYHYPPPFLLAPRAVEAVVGSNFSPIRAAWFALSGLVFMLAIGLVGRSLGPEAQLRSIFVAPAVWLSVPVQQGLQMSNVQILVMSVAVIGLIVMARSSAAGGAMVAMTIVAKLFPGILLVYLAARRRWRDLAWTLAFSVGFCLLALAVLGRQPFRAFLDFELPHLSSGEAFKGPFSRLFAVARNMAPFGIALKLERLGVPGMGLGPGRMISRVFGLVVFALAIWAGRGRRRHDPTSPLVALALLGLASLGSPFAPANYVLVPLIWLVAMHPGFGAASGIAVWLLAGVPFFLPRETTPFLVQTLAFLPAQALAMAIPAVILWRAGRSPAAEPGREPLGGQVVQAS